MAEIAVGLALLFISILLIRYGWEIFGKLPGDYQKRVQKDQAIFNVKYRECQKMLFGFEEISEELGNIYNDFVDRLQEIESEEHKAVRRAYLKQIREKFQIADCFAEKGRRLLNKLYETQQPFDVRFHKAKKAFRNALATLLPLDELICEYRVFFPDDNHLTDLYNKYRLN